MASVPWIGCAPLADCRALTLSSTGGEGPTPTTGAGKVMYCGIALTGIVLVAAYSEPAAAQLFQVSVASMRARSRLPHLAALCPAPAPRLDRHLSARRRALLLQLPTWPSSCSSATRPL